MSLVSAVLVVSKVFSLSLLTVVWLVCIVVVMKAQFEVDKVLWGKIRLKSILAGVPIGDLICPVLEESFGGGMGMPDKPSKRAKVKSEVGDGVVGVGPVSKPVVARPAAPVSEFQCKVCGQPTKGAFLCPKCEKL